MKVLLDKNGWLYFERGAKKFMVEQLCPYSGSKCSCGTWCPLFSEPQYFKSDEVIPFDNVEVSICNRIYNIPENDFVDER